MGWFCSSRFFGESKGGSVVKRFTADLLILDARFENCRPEADYTIFKEGKPVKLEIEVEALSIPEGDELEFCINGKLLAKVLVDKSKEAEFEHYSDEGVSFPEISAGDEVVIRYQNVDVLRGTFELTLDKSATRS